METVFWVFIGLVVAVCTLEVWGMRRDHKRRRRVVEKLRASGRSEM